MPLRPWVPITPITTSSPRRWRRIASLSMLYVLPTPGAYPRNSLNTPAFFSGAACSNHCSGLLAMMGIFSLTASELSSQLQSFCEEEGCRRDCFEASGRDRHGVADRRLLQKSGARKPDHGRVDVPARRA